MKLVLPGKKQLVAMAVGIVLGAVPAVGFNYWLGVLVERQSADDVVNGASRAVDILENRLNAVAATLDDLVRRGVDSCSPEDMDGLRRAGFAASSVKEFSLAGPDGTIQCTNLGGPSGGRAILTSDRTGDPAALSLEVVRLDDLPSPFIQLRRTAENGSQVAALVPADLLLPVTAGNGGPFAAWVRLTARDGTSIVEGGTSIAQARREQGVMTAQARSPRFGVSVSAEMPKERDDGHFKSLWMIGAVVNALIAIGMLLAGWLLLRRSAGHPFADVERALAAGQFIAYYQPIVHITSAKLLGAEVLVRWRKPDGSIIAPATFVPLLEQSGLITEMTRQLMRRVCSEVGAAYAARPHLRISFNLTADHFADDEVVDDVREIFDGSPIHLSQVVLELTERQPLHNVTATRRVIAALQGLGCSIALDDVGTGHSGLSSILRLGVDIIKIDKMFIDSISSERNSATIIETLVDLARNMRMHVIAEGVENFAQVADLRTRGIRAAQGYVFAPPLPGSAFLGLLEAIDPLPEGRTEQTSARLAAG